jgi:hypothetical protein
MPRIDLQNARQRETSRLVTSLRYDKSECKHYAVGRLGHVKGLRRTPDYPSGGQVPKIFESPNFGRQVPSKFC